MNNLAKILSVLVVWLTAGNALGNTPPLPPPGVPIPPFVHVTVPKQPLQLGDVMSGGVFQAGAEMKVHVLANCPYQLEASFRDLKSGVSNEPLPPQQVMIAINGKRTSLGGRVPLVVSGQPTPSTGTDIPVGLQVGVNNIMNCRAGRYNGTLVITVMALP